MTTTSAAARLRPFTTAQQDSFLRALGLPAGSWLKRRASTRTFQQAFNLGPALSPDGRFGPATSAAARVSIAHGYRVSASFRLSEFRCGCGGRSRGCRTALATRELLRSLEALRSRSYPAGLAIVSGYRCPSFNRRVGGISTSHHLTGEAADVPRRVRPGAISTSATGLTGIGYGHHGLVIHVDVGEPRRVVFLDA